MSKHKTWEVKPVQKITNDGQFTDSYGNEVKHGTEIVIESNCNFQHFNNRPAVVEWNAERGLYTFRFIDGGCMGLGNDFYGIGKFRVREKEQPSVVVVESKNNLKTKK